MQAADWSQIEKLLEEALELPFHARSEFLDRNCSDNAGVRREVESLLACEQQAEKILQSPAIAFSSGLFDNEADEEEKLVGQMLGNYTIAGELGHGGMGAVYLAERREPDFTQRVAVKFLRRELNTTELRRRFNRERQILASLEHPNITRLLDLGATADGVPFFVMEYVEGKPINQFCENLPLEDALKLFERVCETVAFAHRNLVVHRDLKPSNILVTSDGIPKLLDFGISKLLTPDAETDSEVHTITNLGALTPEYAAPEQLRGENITTASDIYSLGVILYEILTSRRPFALKKLSPAEMIREVCSTEPEKPSAFITREDFLTTQQKYQPETKPNFRNPKLLRGDLDNIVLTALQKEPARRYGTVEKFAEDIERHLQKLPVRARPNTFSYRAAKFIRRNVFAVVAGLIILLSLCGGLAATAWQAEKAERERRNAEAQSALAQKRFADVRSLANSFVFEVYPQIEKLDGATAARNTVVKRALEYLDNLSQEAAGDVDLQRELAAAYEKVSDVQGNPTQSNLGDLPGALESSRKAGQIRQNVLAKDPANPTLRDELAANYEQTGVLLWWSSDTASATQSYEQALAIRREIVAENPASTEYRARLAELLMDAGDVPAWNSESEKAIADYREAQTILEKLVAEDSQNKALQAALGSAFERLGSVQKDVEDFGGGISSLNRAQAIYAKLLKDNPNDYEYEHGLWKVKFSECEMFLVKPDAAREAIESCGQLSRLAENLAQKDARNTQMKHDLVSSYRYLGNAYLQAGKYDRAIEELQKVLSVNANLQAAFPDNDEYKRNEAVSYLDIGKADLHLGNAAAALENDQKARKLLAELAAADENNSAPQFDLATAIKQTGEAYRRQNNEAAARAAFTQALEILQRLDSRGELFARDKELITTLQSDLNQKK